MISLTRPSTTKHVGARVQRLQERVGVLDSELADAESFLGIVDSATIVDSHTQIIIVCPPSRPELIRQEQQEVD